MRLWYLLQYVSLFIEFNQKIGTLLTLNGIESRTCHKFILKSTILYYDKKHFNVDFEICAFSSFLSESLGHYPLIKAMLIAVSNEDFLTKHRNW